MLTERLADCDISFLWRPSFDHIIIVVDAVTDARGFISLFFCWTARTDATTFDATRRA